MTPDSYFPDATFQPPREIQILEPYNVRYDNGVTLAAGSRVTVRGDFAASLLEDGRAVDPFLDPDQTAALARRKPPASVPPPPYRSGKTARIRILRPFSIAVEPGVVLEPGEHTVAVEWLHAIGDRAERLDGPARPARAKCEKPKGEPHLIRVLGQRSPGWGIWSVALQRHVDYGEEITVPDEEAAQLIRMGRAVSLRPEMPDPAVEEFADFMAPGNNKEKRAKAVSIARQLLKGR